MVTQSRLLNTAYFRILFKLNCFHKIFKIYISNWAYYLLNFQWKLTSTNKKYNEPLFQHQNPTSFCHICLIYQYFFMLKCITKNPMSLIYFSKTIYLSQEFFYNHNVIIIPNWLTIISFIQYLMHYPNFPDYLNVLLIWFV